MNKLFSIIVLFGFLVIGCSPAFNEGKIVGKKYIPPESVWVNTGYSGFLATSPERYRIFYQGEYNQVTSADVGKETFDALQVGGYFSYSRYKANQ